VSQVSSRLGGRFGLGDVLAQDQISGFLGRAGGGDDELAVAFQRTHPAVKVGDLVFDDVVIYSAFGAKECGGHFGDELLARIVGVTKAFAKLAVEPGLVTTAVPHFV